MTILQLHPMLPVFIPSMNKEGYAFAIIEYSQEDYLFFAVALDDTGEIWIKSNRDVRFCKNVTMGRELKRMRDVRENFAGLNKQYHPGEINWTSGPGFFEKLWKQRDAGT